MEPANNQIIRNGAYGIVVCDSKILLTQKKSGPYKCAWGLPGGAIEFGETPEKALRRELLEETALQAGTLEFFNITTSTCEYVKQGKPYGFHHIGVIYKVLDWSDVPEAEPEEVCRWVEMSDASKEDLTPFAKYALSKLPATNKWRPSNRIRGKAVGLALHGNRLLVCEVRDDHGILKGWCPPGGGIEFGETSQEALKREMMEEFGCGIQITGQPIIVENMFEHHGHIGHEIVFAFPIILDDPSIYAKKRFQIYEQNGCPIWVEWIDITCFKNGTLALFPKLIANQMVTGQS